MDKRFSERIGKIEVKTTLMREGISPELRNLLWSLVRELIIDIKEGNEIPQGYEYSYLSDYFRKLWIYFFKYPIDTLPWGNIFYDKFVNKEKATLKLRNWFFESEWYLVLDFIEFSSKFHTEFIERCNCFLKIEFSAYRFVDGKLVEINSKEEIVEIENAINNSNSNKFNPVNTHLKTALNLLSSDRKNPDYRNSIKESISAVESLSKIITSNNKTTLGQALTEIEKKHKIPNSLKSAFSSLYGYTSDEGGIRHSLLETSVIVDIEEARFMLIACSAFVNYLMGKI